MNNTLDISWGTILKIGIAALAFYILYLIKDILIWVVFAIIISVLFNPLIDFLQKRRIPRQGATVLVYIVAFGFLGFLIYLTSPVFVSEIQKFSQFFPQYFEKVAPPLQNLGLEAFESFESFIQSFKDWLVKASASIFGAISAIFGGIFSTLTIFTLALFLSLEEGGMERTIRIFSPKGQEDYILNLWKSCQNKVSGWFGVKVLGCLFVGLFSYLTLWLCKIDYPLALSLFAAITNVIPIVGPIIAGIIIAIISALDSFLKAIIVLIVFILIQQIEGNILTPILTKRFIGLPPVLVLVSLMIGAKLWGIMGAILIIPLTGVVYEFLRDFLKKKKEDSGPQTPPPTHKKSIVW